MSARFAGRVAIITGAAKGMGLATAAEMARDGAAVVMTDIDAAGLEEAAAQVRSQGAAC
jgi:NAD(P)-dependent dehydrogenase (short-subunit alcohol dehydrogenase family)